MFESQHFVDLKDNGGFGDPRSWLSGDGHSSSPTHSRTQSSLSSVVAAAAAAAAAAGGTSGNVDRALYNDLVEMVPLVQSLIDRKTSSSFTRRGSVIYTKTPSRESLSKKVNEPKGKNAAQSVPTKKRTGDKDQGKNAGNNQEGCADSFSEFSSRALASEKESEKERVDLNLLKGQLEDLQRKLVEKDELLKLAEITKNQMTATQAELDKLKGLAAEKDSLLRSTQSQLSNAKIKLADKQAALEKIQWEAQTSSRKVEMLQDDLNSTQGGISFMMTLFEGLAKNDSSSINTEDLDAMPNHGDYLPGIDDLEEMDVDKMEEAREAYIAAVAAAREKEDEESLALAANARVYLQSFLR